MLNLRIMKLFGQEKKNFQRDCSIEGWTEGLTDPNPKKSSSYGQGLN